MVQKTDIAMALGVLLLGAGLYFIGGSLAAFLHRSTNEPGVESLVGLAVSILGQLVLVWWALTFCIALIAEILSRRGLHPAATRTGSFSPVFMRSLACAVLGFSLFAVPAAHADAPAPASVAVAQEAQQAAEAAAPSPLWAAAGETHVPEPLWQPTAPPADGGLLVKADRTAGPSSANTAEVIVQPGDSLWSIAAKHLGPTASEAEVAKAWPQWFAANKQVIGEQPDLLLPGQVLYAPTGS
ncbi:LysM peptidoglycan-binding domain-containing protein [Arthrobacter tecti]